VKWTSRRGGEFEVEVEARRSGCEKVEENKEITEGYGREFSWEERPGEGRRTWRLLLNNITAKGERPSRWL
jgi:hypothetical protein